MKKRIQQATLLALVSVAVLHCGLPLGLKSASDDDNPPQRKSGDVDAPLNLVNGNEWSLGSGRAKLFVGEARAAIAFYGEVSEDPCAKPPEKRVGFWLDSVNTSGKEVRSTTSGTKGFFSFYVDEKKVNTAASAFQLTNLMFTESRVSGKLHAEGGATFYIDSTFDFPICPNS